VQPNLLERTVLVRARHRAVRPWRAYAGKPDALRKGEEIGFGPGGKRGVWRTIGGNPIFIEVRKGESVPQAVRRTQKGQASLGPWGEKTSSDLPREKEAEILASHEAFTKRYLAQQEAALSSLGIEKRTAIVDEVRAYQYFGAIPNRVSWEGINNILRKGQSIKSGNVAKRYPEIQARVATLDAFTKNVTLTQDETVYRGVVGARAIGKLAVGSAITSKQFLSTGSSLAGVHHEVVALPGGEKAFLRIKLPKGASVGLASAVTDSGVGEVLLGRGTKVRIVGRAVVRGIEVYDAQLEL